MRSFFGQTMEALVIGLVAIVTISFISLATTQTIINDTGKEVTGITIRFSTAVMITDYDRVFPEQLPTGRSDKFTFSGGKLSSFGRFTVSWVPSPARITAYKWIIAGETAESASTTSVPPAAGTTATGVPDPNTPPILYGNNYPGPDEPVYHPKPGEKFWLTDLGGHGDIYDNDGIRINFAPDIDKSTIGHIEWYRNGIHLPFLDDKLQITNAEMKTFTGIPAEHSPASHHTDHAIMGYTYGVAIFPKGYTGPYDWVDAETTLIKTVKSGFRWRPREIWVHLNGVWMTTLKRVPLDEVIDFFRFIKSEGFTGISFEMHYYVDSPYASTVKILDHYDTSIIKWGAYTASEPVLERILKAIDEVGLETNIIVQLYVSQKYQNEHGVAFCKYPRDPQSFFNSYADVLLKITPLLNKYHVKLFTVLDEEDTLEADYPNLVSELLSKISNAFEGELGIDEATNNMLSGHSCLSKQGGFLDLVKNFSFWGWKDKIGRSVRIEYSCWDPPMETQNDQRASIMPANFVKFWKTAVNYYTARYPNNIQMFGEIGVPSGDGACSNPNYYNVKNKRYDDQEAADGWYAQLVGSKILGIDRLDIWMVSLADYWPNWGPGGSLLGTGFKRAESPAYCIIKAIIGPDSSP